jgi:hypothetical protein
VMGEEWRIIPGFPEYAVSDLGRVRRCVESQKGNLPKVLKPWVNNQGYQIITVFANGKPSRKQISRLVCEAFHGPPPTQEHHAAHGDGDPSNNKPANLRWATRTENMADCLIHGTRAMGARHGRSTKPERTPRGSSHGHSKITERDVLAIRAVPKTIGSGVRLAARYGVSPAAICVIRSRKNWKHI